MNDPATPSTFASNIAARAPPPPPRDNDARCRPLSSKDEDDVVRRLNERLTTGLHCYSRGSSAGRWITARSGAPPPPPEDKDDVAADVHTSVGEAAARDASTATLAARLAQSTWQTAGDGAALPATTLRTGVGSPSTKLAEARAARRRDATARRPLAEAEKSVAAFRLDTVSKLSPGTMKHVATVTGIDHDLEDDYVYGEELRGIASAVTVVPALDSEDELDDIATDGVAAGAGALSSDDDEYKTPLSRPRGPYATRLAAQRRREAASATASEERGLESPEAFEASRIDKLLEGLGAVLPTLPSSGAANPSPTIHARDGGKLALGPAKKLSRHGRLSPSSPPLRAVAAAAARGAKAAAAAAGRPTETEAGFLRVAATRQRVSGALQSLWAEYQDSIGHLAVKSEEEVNKAQNVLRFISDWIVGSVSGGGGDGKRKKKQRGRVIVPVHSGSGGLDGRYARARRRARRRRQREQRREESRSRNDIVAGSRGAASEVDESDAAWRRYCSDPGRADERRGQVTNSRGAGPRPGADVFRPFHSDHSSPTTTMSSDQEESDLAPVPHPRHLLMLPHPHLPRPSSSASMGSVCSAETGGAVTGFDTRAWQQQRQRGDFYADRLVEEVRAQLVMLEQLKRRHSLPPSPPDSPVKPPGARATTGGITAAGPGSSGSGLEGHSNGSGEAKREEANDKGVCVKTFATAGIQVDIPVKGPKLKNRGTHPHRDLTPPQTSAAGTQCEAIEAAVASTQCEVEAAVAETQYEAVKETAVGIQTSPISSVSVGRDTGCGPSRAASPEAPPPPRRPATASATTSTTVSIPFDAPEPLWEGAPKYPVAQVATKPTTVAAHPVTPSVDPSRRSSRRRKSLAVTSDDVAPLRLQKQKQEPPRQVEHQNGRDQGEGSSQDRGRVPDNQVQHHSDSDDSLSLSDSDTDDTESDNAGAGNGRAPVFAPFSSARRVQTQWEFVSTPFAGTYAAARDVSETPWAGAAGNIPMGVMSAAKVRQMYPELFQDRRAGGGGGDDDDDGIQDRVLIGRAHGHGDGDASMDKARAGREAIASGEIWRGLPERSTK